MLIRQETSVGKGWLTRIPPSCQHGKSKPRPSLVCIFLPTCSRVRHSLWWATCCPPSTPRQWTLQRTTGRLYFLQATTRAIASALLLFYLHRRRSSEKNASPLTISPSSLSGMPTTCYNLAHYGTLLRLMASRCRSRYHK
jgi:hypothetical protein